LTSRYQEAGAERSENGPNALHCSNPMLLSLKVCHVALLGTPMIAFQQASSSRQYAICHSLHYIRVMSALPPKADIDRACLNVRFVPKADIPEH
jgi:hypothetical protein